MSLVKQILEQVEGLPAVPAVVQQVLAHVADPNFDYRQLVKLVRLDPGITADVLRMANSPYFGLRRKISSLEQALVHLGANHIVDLVLSTKVVGMYKSGQDGYGLARGDLWRHSMASALLAQELAQRLGHGDKATVFTAGLLHDVGKLILSEYVGEHFERIAQAVRTRGQSWVAAEREVLGVDHALLGAVAARKWNFPEPIVEAIAFHHHAERAAKERQLACIVALSNLLALSFGVGGGVEGLLAPVPEGLMTNLGLKARDLDQLGLKLKDILDQADDLLGLAS